MMAIEACKIMDVIIVILALLIFFIIATRTDEINKIYLPGIYLTPTPPREKKYAGGVIFWRSSSRQTVNHSG
ncbi:TPA: hypothetical protein G9F27_002984 [Salmonella enterica]|uniref:Uncharacterized protein n=1 Tax=Salmonella enterica TaxID=28901 RepID=A0A743SQN2_SALER|nr:hypothetical protein [Salmonella enterica]